MEKTVSKMEISVVLEEQKEWRQILKMLARGDRGMIFMPRVEVTPSHTMVTDGDLDAATMSGRWLRRILSGWSVHREGFVIISHLSSKKVSK